MDRGADLAGLRVLLPRPQRDNDRFATALEAMGCQVLRLPVMAIIPLLTRQERREFAHSLGHSHHVIFVSATAASLALEAFTESSLPFPPDVNIFAIGQATADTLREAGLRVISPPDDATSEGLLKAPELAGVEGHRVLICRGRGGRDKLREVLEARGAWVAYRDLYVRQPIADWADDINARLEGGGADVAVFHSGEIFAAFWRLLTAASREKIRNLPVLVPGQRVGALVREQGCGHVITAANALPGSMAEALVHWYTQREIHQKR